MGNSRYKEPVNCFSIFRVATGLEMFGEKFFKVGEKSGSLILRQGNLTVISKEKSEKIDHLTQLI